MQSAHENEEDRPAPPQPRDIPGFTLEGLIGEGGMGLVYRAIQHNPRRAVALKLLKPAAVSTRALRRFDREAQILARLQHPSIARIYDAGVIEPAVGALSGVGVGQPTPYFVMELIEGSDLIRHAENVGLSVRDRLQLFAQVCDAVHYAHQKGVIHRDLKPANILIDQAGRPKVLDFGIARVIGSEQTLTSMQTDIGQLLGTLVYMSPEQVVGDPASVDARSDVYALGVTLYELLCGRRPYLLQTNSLPEAARVIRDEYPDPLSTHDRALRGDIETIVGKCLEKEPDRRYASAGELATDLRRYLASQPIVARPPSAWYQTTRFTKRNKALVAGLSAVFVTLLLGMVGTSIGRSQAIEAREREAEHRVEAERQRLEAEASARRAESSERAMARALDDEKRMRELAQTQSRLAANTSSLYIDMINSINPSVAQGKDVTLLIQVLEAGERLTDQRLREHPGDASRLRLVIGQSYMALGRNDKARRQFELASELAIGSIGPASQQAQRCAYMLASTYDYDGDYEQSLVLNKHVAACARRVYGIESTFYINALTHLNTDYFRLDMLPEMAEVKALFAQLSQYTGSASPTITINIALVNAIDLMDAGEFDEAFDILDPLFREQLRELGPSHPDTLHTMLNLSYALIEIGAPRSATKLINDFMPTIESVYRDNPVKIYQLQTALAKSYAEVGRYDLCIPMQQRLVEQYTQSLGPKHPETLKAYMSLAESLRLTGQNEEARKAYLVALEGNTEVLGPRHPHTINTHLILGVNLYEMGEYQEAENHIQTFVDIATQQWGADSLSVMVGRNSLAICLFHAGDIERALRLSRSLYEDAGEVFGPDHLYVSRYAITYGQCLFANDDLATAEAVLLKALDNLPPKIRADKVDRITASKTLAEVYRKLGLPEKEKVWREHAESLREN